MLLRMTRQDDEPTVTERGDVPTVQARPASRSTHRMSADALAAELPPGREGELEHRYDLGERLGVGGMGEILRCQDKRIGRDVALKRLLPDRTNGRHLRRFVREARVQGQLQHPSVVPVHDLGVDSEGNPYFVMKRIRGRTLADIVQKLGREDRETQARFGRRALLSAFGRACLALEYAHERGVVHRDLKPSNLMLGDFGELYVLDWGVAQVDGSTDFATFEGPLSDVAIDDTQEGSFLGTVGYASPEQCRGHKDEIGPAADIYSMGVILYEILTLRRLHRSGSEADRVAVTLRGVHARPSEVDPSIAPELDAICLRATQLDPADRFASMRELHDAVESYLAGERNEELRMQLADEHAARAERALEGPLSLAAREGALRDIGRALALGREKTAQLFLRLLDSPSAETLGAVDAALEDIQNERVRHAMRIGVPNYLLWIALVPLMLWSGVRSPAPLWLAGSFIACAAVCCAIFARRKRIGRAHLYVVFLLNLAAIAAATRVFGPLIIVPQVLLATNFSFCLTNSRIDRAVFATLAVLCVLGPIDLELAGILPSSYAFDARGMHVVPHTLFFPQASTLVLLTVITVGNLISSTLFCGVVRGEIDRAQARSVLQFWHLERLFGLGATPPPR
jgi:hypothetical protein